LPDGFITGAGIIHHSDPALPELLRGWFEDPETLIVGHNVAYDIAVIAERFPELRELIFAAYDADRVTDTKIRQQLLDIAAGVFRGRLNDRGQWITHEYTLEALARRCAGMQLQKDAWRLSYGEFINTPLDEWVTKAREVQARAAARLNVLSQRPHAGQSAEEKALKKEIQGLREMVESDPSQCIKYPLDDARATLAVFLAQEKHGDRRMAWAA
jgi:hypothetical protein